MHPGEERATWFMLAHQHVEDAAGILSRQIEAMDSYGRALAHATEGSAQAEAEAAMGHIAGAAATAGEVLIMMPSIMTALEMLAGADLRNRLGALLIPAPTREAIGGYAESALSGLVRVMTDARRNYQTAAADRTSSDQAAEDAAASRFGLPTVGEALDRIEHTQRIFDRADAAVGASRQSGRVILPPNHELPPPQPPADGLHPWQRRVLPRLKAVLLMLNREFGIDVTDPTEVSLETGIVTRQMVRRSSYTAVGLPALNRTVLVCDESRNASFVLDSRLLRDQGISEDMLLAMHKQDLGAMLDAEPALGQRITYSAGFLADVRQAVQADSLAARPETLNSIIDKLHLGRATLLTKIREYGTNDKRLHGLAARLTEPAPRLTVREQEVLTDALDRDGLLIDEAPPGVRSAREAAAKAKVKRSDFYAAMTDLGDDLGPTGPYRFGSRRAAGLTAEQEERVLARLAEKRQHAEPPPKGYLALEPLAERLGVDRKLVKQAVGELGDTLGKRRTYYFAPYDTAGYSPGQQTMISRHLAATGKLRPPAPADVRSVNGMAALWDINYEQIDRAIQALGEMLGPAGWYIFTSKAARGYEPEQQAMLRTYLEAKGLLPVT